MRTKIQHLSHKKCICKFNHHNFGHFVSNLFCLKQLCSPWIILCMRLANERQHYKVTSHLPGWAHEQIGPWFRLRGFLSLLILAMAIFRRQTGVAHTNMLSNFMSSPPIHDNAAPQCQGFAAKFISLSWKLRKSSTCVILFEYNSR